MLTVDSLINISRVQSRVKLGGHDVPVDRIIQKKNHFEFLKREKNSYFDECEDWLEEDIKALTEVEDAEKGNLNKNTM